MRTRTVGVFILCISAIIPALAPKYALTICGALTS
jgi:hypothetical protein